MGWERKRGKLEQFNAALRGQADGFSTIVGELAALQGVRYVIALDSDTQLPRDAARQLAGTLAHPLNRPHHDERLGRVTSGYSILQPRVAITLASVGRSRFARLFAGEPGIDPYTLAVSDVYQDLFAEGSFVGKGIYDVDAFARALHGRLPENHILSHDLLEGAYARAGLVSDITLFEDYPSAHAADLCRRDRWMRGDWQIVAWLWGHVHDSGGRRVRNPISTLSRWKLIDNLRRSLVPVALLALLLIGWAVGAALAVTLVVLGVLALPGLLTAAAELVRRPTELPRRQHLRAVARTLGRQLLREGFAVATLPHDALLALRAIARTLLRVLFTRRKLLEWRTAADAQRGAATTLAGCYALMWIAPATALATSLALALLRPDAIVVAAPVLALWALAPALAAWLSQPLRPVPHRLAEPELRFLRSVARRTWRFFETFVTPEDNDLPPDNFQEDPPQGVAHRTSPTNIGLALTANLAAHDFGYLSTAGLIDRCSRTLAAMDRLQRHRGHLFNWYDTRTLEPLRPRYVSTVDSGNLAGHLLTLAAGLGELADHRLLRPETFAGLVDTLDLLADLSPSAPDLHAELQRMRLTAVAPPTLSAAHRSLTALLTDTRELTRLAGLQRDPEADWCAQAIASQCQHALAELEHMAPWTALLSAPMMVGPASIPGELAASLARLDAGPTSRTSPASPTRWPRSIAPPRPAADTTPGSPTADRLRGQRARPIAHRLALARCEEFADLDYDFLYDRERHLLAIGYNVHDYRLDASYYDLLASEARLASFVAIAQGKLPQEHWFSLGRLLTTTGGKPALLSWSGSMFEYLMPLLIMPTYAGTILGETYRAVVARQIEYGRERGVPWGVSESGYNKTDAQLNYQYRAFGVPGLGFKRGLADDLVVAPYATAMALMVDPAAATDNLRRLARDGMLGGHGFYEAIDYTPARLPRGKDSVSVRSYMAHHQGMAFLSFAYLLLGRPMQRRFDAQLAFRATDLLLQERVARTPPIYPHPAEVALSTVTPAEAEPNLRIFTTPNTAAPELHLLSNGSYHVAITNAGAGYSRWRDLAVTRWHEDPTRDSWGSFCYLRDVTSHAFWSVAFQPTLVAAASYEAIYTQGRAEFRRRDGDIETHVEISVSPEDDVELRRVCVTNRGRTRSQHRADQLRRGRAHHPRRRRGPPRVQQPVRPDRAGAPAPGHPVHPAAALRRREAAAHAAPHERPGRDPRPHLLRDRPRRVHRPRSIARRPGGDAPPRARRQRGLRPRSGGGDPQHGAAPPARDRTDPPRHRHRRDPRGRPRPDREVQRSPLRRARARAVVDPQPGAAAPHRRQRGGHPALRAPRRPHPVFEPTPARAPERARPQPQRPVGAVGLRHLGRPADRAGPHRRQRPPRAAAPDGQGPRLLAPQGPRRGPRDLERGPVRLPPGPARRDPRRDRLALRGQPARPPRRHLRAPQRAARRGRQGAHADRRAPHRPRR
nr:glucoamylase family protein [Nannocystis sp.]